MREIIFRGKRIENNEWVYGYYHVLTDTLANTVEHCILQEYRHTSDVVDPETVGQYTGLKDKNGTKIFEGDIVKLVENIDKYEWPAVVEFGNPNSYYSWGWQLKPITKNVEYNLDTLCWIDMDDVGVSCEVIGNRHDNPELLKGDEKC